MDFTTEQHWQHFADFCRWSLAAGGPAQNIDLVRKMASTVPCPQERAWRAMCYGATYNVPYAEVLWREWSFARIRTSHFAEVLKWCEDVMGRQLITTRIERRCVRRPDWMAQYLWGARHFVEDVLPKLLRDCATMGSPHAAYEHAWGVVTDLPRVGRYMTLRLLELFRREEVLHIAAPDIRPRDAWSPRRTLAMLWPERNIPEEGNRDDTIDLVNRTVQDTVKRLEELQVTQSLFQLQVHLCEYRQSCLGRRQYPGRPLDSELGYAKRAGVEWGKVHPDSQIWWARLALFPSQHLGEVMGWDGPRKDVGAVLADHGYVWSDLVYDYTASAARLSQPVKWEQSH